MKGKLEITSEEGKTYSAPRGWDDPFAQLAAMAQRVGLPSVRISGEISRRDEVSCVKCRSWLCITCPPSIDYVNLAGGVCIKRAIFEVNEGFREMGIDVEPLLGADSGRGRTVNWRPVLGRLAELEGRKPAKDDPFMLAARSAKKSATVANRSKEISRAKLFGELKCAVSIHMDCTQTNRAITSLDSALFKKANELVLRAFAVMKEDLNTQRLAEILPSHRQNNAPAPGRNKGAAA